MDIDWDCLSTITPGVLSKTSNKEAPDVDESVSKSIIVLSISLLNGSFLAETLTSFSAKASSLNIISPSSKTPLFWFMSIFSDM